jgi:hypothetical protein
MEQPNNNIMSISSGEEDNNNVYIHKPRKQRKDKKIVDMLEYKKLYYYKHKETINEYYKKKFICGCGKTLSIGGKAKHLNSDRHLEYEHNLKYNIINHN